jgi:Dockerin type I domain
MKHTLFLVSALILLAAPAFAQSKGAGDLNDDGRVDQSDLTLLEQYLDGSGLLQEEQTQRADLNGDSQIDVHDVNVMRKRLGLATVPEPFNLQVGQKSSGKKTASFQLGLDQVVPEWVRGNWTFASTIYSVEGSSFGGAGGGTTDEAITLPGDLSKLYSVFIVSTGEKLKRVCWQVNNYSEKRFSFTEQSQDSSGAIYASTSEIIYRGPGVADIRIRTEILNAGNGYYPVEPRNSGGGGLLGGLLGLFGIRGSFSTSPSMRGPRLIQGDAYVRGGQMFREPGSEQKRLSDVDLAALRCRN